jgi:hypothetical protein
MNGEGAYLRESHPWIAHGWWGHATRAAWRVAREATASSPKSNRRRGHGAVADARSSGSYWASP